MLKEDKIGTMLPFNVIVQKISGGKVEVAVIDPVASLQEVRNPELQGTAEPVQSKLGKVVESL